MKVLAVQAVECRGPTVEPRHTGLGSLADPKPTLLRITAVYFGTHPKKKESKRANVLKVSEGKLAYLRQTINMDPPVVPSKIIT